MLPPKNGQVVRRPTPILEAKTRQILGEFKSGRPQTQDSIERALGLLLIAKSAENALFRKIAAGATTDAVSDGSSATRRALDRWASTAYHHRNPYSTLHEKARTVSLENGRAIEHFLAVERGGDSGGGSESSAAVSAALLAEVRGRVAALEAKRPSASATSAAVAGASAAASGGLAAAPENVEVADLVDLSSTPTCPPAIWSPGNTLEHIAGSSDGTKSASARTSLMSAFSDSSLNTSMGNTTIDSGSGDYGGIASEGQSEDNGCEASTSAGASAVAAAAAADVEAAVGTEAVFPVIGHVAHDAEGEDGIVGLGAYRSLQTEAPSHRSANTMMVEQETQTHGLTEAAAILQQVHQLRELVLEGLSQVTARQESMEAQLASCMDQMRFEHMQQNARLAQTCKLGLGLQQESRSSTGKGTDEGAPTALEGVETATFPCARANAAPAADTGVMPPGGQTVAIEVVESAEKAGSNNKDVREDATGMTGGVGPAEVGASDGLTLSVASELVALDSNVTDEASGETGKKCGSVDVEPVPLVARTAPVTRTAEWEGAAVVGEVGANEEAGEVGFGGTEKGTGGEDASRCLAGEAGLVIGTTEAGGRSEERAVAAEIVAPFEDESKSKGGELVSGGTVEPLAAVVMGGGIKVLELSAEERGMAGAPQGDIYQVKVLASHEFVASNNLRQDLKVISGVIKDLSRGSDPGWARVTEAVDSARRLLIHHYDSECEGDVDRLEGLVALVLAAMGRLESHAARNGLRCVVNLFRSGGGNFLYPDDVCRLVEAIVRHMVSDRAFMVREAKEAMDAAVAHADKRALLAAIVPLASNNSFKIAQEGVLYTCKCLQGMGVDDFEVGSGIGSVVVDVGRLVEALAKGLRVKSAVSKDAAKKGLARCREIVGDEPLKQVIGEKLADSTVASEVHAVMVACKREGDGKVSRGITTGHEDPQGTKCAGGGRLAALIRAGRAKKAAAAGSAAATTAANGSKEKGCEAAIVEGYQRAWTGAHG